MPDPAGFQQAFGALLAGTAPMPPDTGLERALTVHRNTSTKAALDALRDNFPVVRALVGNEAFDGAGLAFVAAKPPSDPRLCLYGAAFSAFLRDFDPFAGLGYLPDVATVERLVVEALFAADAAPLDAAAITAGIDLDARYALHPAARMARLATPAAAIWQAHQTDGPPGLVDRIAWSAETVLVSRPGEEVAVRSIDASTARFIEQVAGGATLGEAAATIDPDELADAFATMLVSGILMIA